MKLLKRNFFTLIEVLISLSLFGLMVGFIFANIRSTTHLAKKVDRAKAYVLAKKDGYERLLQVFLQVEEGSINFDKELSFAFENGLDQERIFSGIVQAKIFLDNQNVVLRIVSPEDMDKIREEILFKDVRSFRAEVCDPHFIDIELEMWDYSIDHYPINLLRRSVS